MSESAVTEGTPLPDVLAPRNPDFLRLLTYVVSNAREGEYMAIHNYSDIVRLLPGTDAKIEAVRQAKEECSHILLLEKLAERLGFDIDQSMVHAEWQVVRAAFVEAAERGDVAACLIIQDLMVESLAIGLYRLFSSAANSDEETARVARTLLKAELDHLDIGIARINELMQRDEDGVHDALIWAHHKVIPRLFDMVHGSCDFLCSNHELDCDTVDKGQITIDLEALKITSLEHYVEMLYSAGFEQKILGPLIASMTSYEPEGRGEFLREEVVADCADPASCCPADASAGAASALEEVGR
jgi:fatty aldehyde decarbonylase